MKYVILVGDGMGDYPLEELGGRTVLQAAATPNATFASTAIPLASVVSRIAERASGSVTARSRTIWPGCG